MGSPQENIALMYSGGVDSVVCLKLLTEQGITPKLFFIATYKVKKKHIEQVKRNAKRINPDCEVYVFRPRMIDYCAGYTFHKGERKSYFVHMHEQDSEPEFYPLRYCDKVVIGYVGKQPVGRRRNGELGLAQKHFIEHCDRYQFPIILPLKDMTTRDVDKIFKELPKEVQEATISTTRDYRFGGAYLH